MAAHTITLAAAGILCLVPAFAQEKPNPDRTDYKIEFTIRDDSGKGARKYTVVTDGEGKGILRVGNKVPYISGSFQPGVATTGISPLVSTQYQYAEIGVNIECRLRNMGGGLMMNTSLEISAVLPPDKNISPPPANPLIAHTRFELSAAVSPGKPMQLTSVDDPVAGRKFDVEVTVRKLD